MITFMKSRSYFARSLALSLALLLAGAVAAWTGPSSAPPNGNVAAPVNVSGTAQVKSGGFWASSVGSDSGYCIGASCITSWPSGGSGFTGSGSTNYLTKFIGATALGNSLIYDNGTNVGIGETAPGSKLSVSGGGSFGSGYDTTAAPTGGLIIEGNVGIGTTDPQGKLHLASLQSSNPNNLILEGYVADGTARTNASYIRQQFDTNAGFGSYWKSVRGANGGTYEGALGVRAASSDVDVITWRSDGNVGIGTTSPAFLLSVQNSGEGNTLQLYDTDGNCRIDPDSGGLTTTCSSDARLKTDIISSPPVLSYLNGLPIKEYTVIASGDRRTGVVAQELLSAGYSSLVSMGEDGYYGVSEIPSWKIIKGVQELDAKINSLAGGSYITDSSSTPVFYGT